MDQQTRLVLSGQGPKVDGLHWETERLLRIGRQGNVDVVLQDPSVEKLHAEVCYRVGQWMLRDLAKSDAHPTRVNGKQVKGQDVPLKADDLLQFGKLALRVSVAEIGPATPLNAIAETDPRVTVPTLPSEQIQTSGGELMRVEARASQSWDQALEVVAFNKDQRPQQGQAMLALLRANHHLSHLSSLEELCQSILVDVTLALGAQRGSIILATDEGRRLHLKAYLRPGKPDDPRREYSKTLTDRCFRVGESMLCTDVAGDNDLRMAQSVRAGSMSSIICALLRSPRQKIGVMQLDRGPLQPPFTENDLYLADAIAATVAIGIESAQLVENQREQFIQTVTTLARAVEMRDQYTGDHTKRVTDYSMLLATELKLSTIEKYQIQIGTPLHDIGKIGIDDAILRKPARLSTSEFEQMKTHTVKGADMLQTMYNLVPMIPIVRHHHERWDGTGYPDRLKGEQTPLNARIVAVADAFDAMTSHRPYRRALPPDLAFAELLAKAGSHFDPTCVHAFLKMRATVEKMMAKE